MSSTGQGSGGGGGEETPSPSATSRETLAPGAGRRRFPVVPLVIGLGVVAIGLAGQTLFRRAAEGTNQVPLTASPKGVTTVRVAPAQYRPTRRYVGTLQPWVEARIGPQMVSAYVSSVLVRPGAMVHRGEVLATLDCREANASSRAVALQARALEARQRAVASEATRLTGLLDGGFVSPNEVEQRQAESQSEQARLLATRAQLLGTSLMVNDCVLRAPFDGEVGARTADPGAFVRPGASIVSLVDRSIVRVAADVPETDYDAVAPGTPVRLKVLSTGRELAGTVARRSPSADPNTRTLHVEIDVPNPDRRLPVETTAELTIEVGDAVPASEIPLTAANVRGRRANVFVVENGVAHARTVAMLGERGGSLFVDPSVPPGAEVVTEGRALLADGDRVTARMEATPTAPATPAAPGTPAPSPEARAPREQHR